MTRPTLAVLSELFLTFARIGLFTFGGGYAMLPILQRELIDKRQWVSEKELLDYYAIGQVTPGIISVNTATFVGHRLKGVLGGLVATLGVITPSCVLVLLVASSLELLTSTEFARHAFAGVRVAVAALMVQAIVQLWKSSVHDVLGIALFALGFCVATFTALSPVVTLAIALGVGLAANHVGLVRRIQRQRHHPKADDGSSTP
ncbi:MAG: chromate transporter [Myxococcales bacterium]|jgi:chromate transporter|nr:chromate transporter [Myxococcales bacterium]